MGSSPTFGFLAVAAILVLIGCQRSVDAPRSPSTSSAGPPEIRVAAIVSATYHARTRRVAVIGDYALAEWVHAPALGQKIGEAVVIKMRGTWRVVAAGGGRYTTEELVGFGVPRRVAGQLRRTMRWQ